MKDDLTARLAACYTGVVHDIMRGMGLRDFTFPPEIRPIMPETPMAGPVFAPFGHSMHALRSPRSKRSPKRGSSFRRSATTSSTAAATN